MCDVKMVNKGVSFNVFDSDQEKLLEHAMKRKNFSAYVKRLIQRDMEGLVVPGSIMLKQEIETESVELDENLMSDLY